MENTTELISLGLNFILSSGIISIIIFYRSKIRKANAEADNAENTADSGAIGNLHDIIEDLRAEKKEAKEEIKEKEKLIDRLYKEKGEDRALILSLTQELAEVKINGLKTHCDVPKCLERHPYTGY